MPRGALALAEHVGGETDIAEPGQPFCDQRVGFLLPEHIGQYQYAGAQRGRCIVPGDDALERAARAFMDQSAPLDRHLSSPR